MYSSILQHYRDYRYKLTNGKVLWCEVLFDLLFCQLHHYIREHALHVVTIYRHTVTIDEDWERVTPIVSRVHLTDFQCVINKVVLEQKIDMTQCSTLLRKSCWSAGPVTFESCWPCFKVAGPTFDGRRQSTRAPSAQS